MTDEELRMMFRCLLILCLGHCLPAVLGGQSIVCHVGDPVMLPCDGPAATDTKEVHVLWLFGGNHACSYKNGSRCEAGHYVNRTRLGSIRQNNFSLAINPVRKDDAGLYVCRINGGDIRIIRLIVDGVGKLEDAVMPPGGGRKRRDTGTAGEDPVCRSYREIEDPPGSETKDKQDSDENPPGASSLVVTAVIVPLVLIAVAIVGAALFTRRLWNWKKDKKQYNMRTSEDASMLRDGHKKMWEPAV